ncbi:MAG: Arc family DNA binding domain-containing protein [Acidobacteria bacterium]|jgi:hypothetical protein|nr:Arc family DNA binding domain-containing protein [Acidobacteriota bacterium]
MPAKKAFLLRLSPEMWEELERWAADDFRSVNGQIESILHEAISRRRKKAPAAPAAGGAGEGGTPADGGKP